MRRIFLRGAVPITSLVLLLACGDDVVDPHPGGTGGEATTNTGGGATSAGGMDGSGGDDATGGTDGSGGDSGQGGFGGSFATPLLCDGPGPVFATHVLATSYGPGQSHGRSSMPEIALGPPAGGGCCQGSLDVVSLGNGGLIVVGFEGNAIADGPGPDFIVFENAFEFGADMQLFAEPGTVEVSADGITWAAFPCSASRAPYDGCAGHNPVHLDTDVSELDPVKHGGDAFDLADVGLSEARFVRVTDRLDLGSVFDLDAVGIIHSVCP